MINMMYTGLNWTTNNNALLVFEGFYKNNLEFEVKLAFDRNAPSSISNIDIICLLFNFDNHYDLCCWILNLNIEIYLNKTNNYLLCV